MDIRVLKCSLQDKCGCPLQKTGECCTIYVLEDSVFLVSVSNENLEKECDRMKRMILSAVLFLVVFIGTYLIVCFLIPGMRLKLDAEPREYFIACITHMVGFKAAVSAVAALVVGALPWIFRKKV